MRAEMPEAARDRLSSGGARVVARRNVGDMHLVLGISAARTCSAPATPRLDRSADCCPRFGAVAEGGA